MSVKTIAANPKGAGHSVRVAGENADTLKLRLITVSDSPLRRTVAGSAVAISVVDNQSQKEVGGRVREEKRSQHNLSSIR